MYLVYSTFLFHIDYVEPVYGCNEAGCEPTSECRCGGYCGNDHICDDQAKQEWKEINSQETTEDVYDGDIYQDLCDDETGIGC